MPIVVAHRGGGSLAPENTLAAFRLAHQSGVGAIELDVQGTRDRKLVVIHDRRVDRTTQLRGLVRRYTQERLLKQDVGSWFDPRFHMERVPTLDQVFEALPRDFLVVVDMKVRLHGVRVVVERVVAVMRHWQRWDSTLVISFNSVALALLRLLEPRVLRGLTWSRHHPPPMSGRWLSPLVSPDWLTPDRGTFSPGVLARAHRQGLSVMAWDLDAGRDPDRWRSMGLDAVVSDEPHLLIGGTPTA